MVDKIHYRWDFIGLSTDSKPTSSTSPKVVDGSTYYEANTSKLYVWYNDQWYEKEAIGGGGIPTTVIDTIWFGTQEAYDAIDPKATKTLYLVQEDVETPVTLSLNSIRNIGVTPKVEIEREIEEKSVEETEEETEEKE